MNATSTALQLVFNKIPRRHSIENVKEILYLLSEYEDLLLAIEAENTWYERNTAIYFEEIDPLKLLIKKSNDNKASKKNKDLLFDEASGAFKTSIQSLLDMYANGSKKD
jgi:hypothetical protein